MNRRTFVKSAAALPLLSVCWPERAEAATPTTAFRRVRPGDPAWPTPASWEKLNQAVGGHLRKLESPLTACKRDASGKPCADVLKGLKNPYYIGDEPSLTQTLGWVDGWTSAPSAYAVAATKSEHVAAAVNFARENHLRLVVKGGGHSYLGTSCAPDSLLVWTRAMNQITLHDAFVGQGCDGKQAPLPAVSVGAGAIWMHSYNEVTTRGGRYVQGGGCATVGVAGLIQSGGFGSFSKNYGLAAAALLEAEVVTADGVVRIANAATNPDLFWGLKGGGGGSLGVVTRLTLRTRELPEFFGGVFGKIKANSDEAYRRLLAQVISFYRTSLFNPHWGEQIRFESGNLISLQMVFQGLNKKQAEEIWRPFLAWVEAAPKDFTIVEPVTVLDIPARHFWNAAYMKQHYPQFLVTDDRPGAPAENTLWEGDQGQAGQFLHGYRSAWLPASLLKPGQQSKLVEALFSTTRIWSVSLHFNKGLAGARKAELAAAKNTAMNPAVLDAFALAILAGGSSTAFPGIPGLEPDLAAARRHRDAIDRATHELLKAAPKSGSYVSESDFFETSWQRSYWGSNYPRLAAVKKKYDPQGLFYVHHGVGSEGWSSDGFTRLAAK